ncbi:MAG: Hsp20/alpha crystallin family protein [Pseudomonadales bacterium]|nr:Hsp20/alpha crystallin family protein [Pseudomonadales bacterium]
MNLIPRNQIFDMDSLFNDFFHGFNRPSLRNKDSEALAGMRVDVHETDESYEIHADLPGVKKEDIEVTLENDVLTVAASKKTETEEKKKGKVIYRERSSGAISRSFSVAPGTTQDDIAANFSDGVLTLTVPKAQAIPETPASQRIPVK